MNTLRKPRPAGGFTLIELMIVVAIIALLASVAYPSYTNQVRKGKRADARAALMNLLQQQERYATQQNTYFAFGAGAVGSGPFKDYAGEKKAGTSHNLGAQVCQNVGATSPTIKDCVEVFAVPANGFTDPEVTMIAIDSMGRKRCTGTKTDRCWK